MCAEVMVRMVLGEWGEMLEFEAKESEQWRVVMN